MFFVPISCYSRGSIALTLACVPTGIKTGVLISPRVVTIFPRRALEDESLFCSSKSPIAKECSMELLSENCFRLSPRFTLEAVIGRSYFLPLCIDLKICSISARPSTPRFLPVANTPGMLSKRSKRTCQPIFGPPFITKRTVPPISAKMFISGKEQLLKPA